MNKATFITVIVMYVFGLVGYVIAFVTVKWAGMDSFLPNVVEGASHGVIWPYILYEWIRFDTPLI